MIGQLFENLEGLGTGGIFLILVLWMVLSFLKRGKSTTTIEDLVDQLADFNRQIVKRLDKIDSTGTETVRLLKELWTLCNLTDPSTGAKKIYSQPSLEIAISKLTDGIAEQVKVMTALCNQVERTRTEVKNIGTK